MSDSNQGGGLLGGLVLGAGFAGMLLLPFYIAARFGAHVVGGACAVMVTTLALFSDALVTWANSAVDCGFRCAAAPGAHFILTMNDFGFWKLAALMWVVFFLMALAPVFIQTAPSKQ